MDTERGPSPGGTTRHGQELARHVREGRLDAARHAVEGMLEVEGLDEVLAVLAPLTSTGHDALTLFLETLDGSGVVRRFAGAALLDPVAVEDVAQDSLISIAQSISGYDGRAKVTTWVHSIVRRRVTDHLRRQRETVELQEADRPSARMSSLIADRVTVHQLLAQLPDLYRIPVVLRDLEQLPYREIAERLDRSEGTVKSQISRGRAMLAGRLEAGGTAAAER